MTTFIRSYFPFTVQASVDSVVPDFKVSTNGTVESPFIFVNAIGINATITAQVSVPVTAAGFITVTNSAGVAFRVPAYTTLA